jgi:hypothetical protein
MQNPDNVYENLDIEKSEEEIKEYMNVFLKRYGETNESQIVEKMLLKD